MDKVKQWVALAVLAALVLLAGGWFLLVSPARTEAADLREQAALQEGTNARLKTSLEVLQARAESLPEKEAELAEVTRRIPAGPALPELLRALEGAASSAGVELTSVVPAPPVPVEAPAPAPVAPPAPATSGEPAAPPPAPPAAPVATGLSSLEVRMVVVGDFYAVEQFLALLEELPRALRVTAVSMDQSSETTATRGGRNVRATLTGQVYLAPPPAAAAAPAGGAQPAPAGGAGSAAAPPSDSAPAS